MTKYFLTMLDSSGIQPYIFGSNRLQENIGASELVFRATTFWAFDALNENKLNHNVEKPDSTRGTWEFDGREIEKDNLDAEVVYAGGGNTLLVFAKLETARQFTRTLTRHILENAPGLTVTAQHLEFDWDEKGALRQARKDLGKKLAKHKQARPLSSPLLGLGVTAVCQSTGLVAVRNNQAKIEIEGKPVDLHLPGEESRLISHETERKIGWRDAANDRLRFQVGESIAGKFRFPSDLDKLGRIMGEESYIAVIHADGNGMAGHVKRIDEDGKLSNREYLKAVRHFSKSVDDASLAALQTVVEKLQQNTKWSQERKRYDVAEKVPLEQDYLPFRPLVFGGDDVTFVANGQLGVTLAVAYLEAFEKETTEFLNDPAVHKYNFPKEMYASTGIAMVKMHYPFARAYDLSEQLAKSAKKHIPKEDDFSALDWHFALSGLSGSLGAIREREYTIRVKDDLIMRPMRLKDDGDAQNGRYWQNGIERIIRELDDERKYARNKVKGLRRPLREGPDETETYRKNFAIDPLPELLPGDSDHVKTGWDGERCLYFDAIELMDHYIPLP